MKIPAGLLGFDGDAVKGEICLKGGNGARLLEEGMKREGNRFTCYALTSEGDAITACLAISSGVVEFVDVIVDGILRASHSNDKSTKHFSKNFDTFIGQVKEGNKYVNKSYQLQVTKRNTDKARNVKTDKASAVSSIEIQIFRQDPNAHKSHSKDLDSDSDPSSLSCERTLNLGNPQRAPTFEDYAEWWNLNPCVDEDAVLTPHPPFEVTGVNHKKLGNNTLKPRILKKWPGNFKLWASFKFLLFSTQDFHKLGFLDTPEYNGTPWSGARSTLKKPVVKDIPQTSKTISAMDANANADDGEDDDEDVVEKRLTESETGIDEPAETIKGKEVRKNTAKSGPSEGTEVSSVLTNLMESARKLNPVIQDSCPSDIRDESPDAEIVATASKPVHLSDDPQVATSGDDEAGESAELLSVPNTKVEKVELTSDDVERDSRNHNNRKKHKSTSMPGIVGAPAHTAWKDPTRSEWNQHKILGSDSENLSTITSNQLHIEQDPTLLNKTQLLSSDNSGNFRQSSVPCAIGETLEKGMAARSRSFDVEVSGSSWEPMTPPASSKKQGGKYFENFGDEKRVLSEELKGANRIKSAARTVVTKDNYSDTSGREASPTINYRQRLADMKAERIKQRSLGLSFESQAPNTKEPVPSSDVDLMETNFDEFINTSSQLENTEMADTIESEPEQKVRSPLAEVDLRSSTPKQGQDPVDLISPSPSQDLATSEQGVAGSQTPTEPMSQSTLEQMAKIQENNRAKRYPSSATSPTNTDKSTGSNRIKIQLDIERTDSDNNGMPLEAMKSNNKHNDVPVDIGNQQDGRQDSPSKTDDESTLSVAPVKPAKQTNTRASAVPKSSPASKTSSTPKTQSTPFSKAPTSQKIPAAKVNGSSTASTQQAKSKKAAAKVDIPLLVPDAPEQSQAKRKKPAPKTSKASKAAAPPIAEEPALKTKGTGRAKAGAGDKRKADQISSAGSSSGSNKTNASPALKQTSIAERETAAAEARMQAAAEKKKALEEKLLAVRDMKIQLEKANEINRQAQALEEENAALEASFLRSLLMINQC
ncbi:hypothetical protein DSL72_008625 [Monilinia vaccinii-corymbosi]|uniref:Uncharacterized protein n=1 Tax=Monilinia vaccinii-corymbosi TaxID=61207 RepID=A0A8A3PPT1_9HELO|nr:hypothetical protein DSL72_008625 [Monilinia vaccinii-corymbosi]